MRREAFWVQKILVMVTIFSLLPAFIFCERFKIDDVKYDITGKTKEYPLKTNVKIDYNKIFKNSDELVEYVKDVKQRLENTRVFQSVEVDFKIAGDESDKSIDTNTNIQNATGSDIIASGDNNTNNVIEEKNNDESILAEDSNKDISADATTSDTNFGEPKKVTLFIKVKDSHHLLILPYPKYSSSSGFSIKAKAKDTNFVGTMETLNAEGNFELEQDDENDDIDYTFGVGVAFKIPFRLGPLDCAWDNNYNLSYTIGETTPEWDLKTGINLEWAFERISFCFDFYQSAIRDLDYEDDTVNGRDVHYGDGTYFVEYGELSVPVILQKVNNWGNITYTPYVNITYNWDADGISHKYQDYDAGDGLLGPEMEFGHKIATSRVNWIENFRNGLDASFGQYVTYNFETYTFSPGFEAELKAYKAYKYVGLCADIYAFANLNSNKNIGDRLRGIRDNQYFNDDTGDDDMKACVTPAAITVSLDLPIRIFRAEWDKLKTSKNLKHVDIINFEFQLSPFIDFALIKNRSTGTTFNPKDGFLDAGIEVLVYPLKWKGIQLRASFGVDISRKMPFIKKLFNQEWRDSVSTWELSIGIGLQY